MRILFLGNNWVAWQVVRWLKKQNEKIVALVIHPPEKRRYGDEIILSSGVNQRHLFDGSHLPESEVIRAIKALEPDIGLSVFFGYIMGDEFLDIFPSGVVNLHPAYLPFNQGSYPNVWSIVERTPAGVTLHYVDPGIDTGDIIARQRVKVEPVDTGGSLYHRLEKNCLDLFKKTWPLIRSGEAPRIPQSRDEGTCHRMNDVDKIDFIEPDRTYKARELIEIIRARSFPPYTGAYYIYQGQKIYLRLQLLNEEQLKGTKDE